MAFPTVFAASTLALVLILSIVLWRYQSATAGAVLGVVGIGWMGLTGVLAANGVLNHFDLPPRFAFVFFPSLVGAVVLARSSTAAAVPWVVLTGLQVFRVGVELLIHAAVERDIAPGQLTWTGLNFDIVTGLVAPIAAFLVHTGKIGRRGLWAFNLMGVGFLVVVVTVALISTPTPFQLMKPDNTWVVHYPYVWLPCIMVASAFWLHALSFKKLRLEAKLVTA